MRKLIAITLLAAASAMAVVPGRVGPVSTYGKLMASGNKLVGSCPAYSSKTVQVKGMSLFWSSAEREASDFYSANALNLMVEDMKIEVIRFALGVDEKDGGSNESDNDRFYMRKGENDQKARVKSMVYSAVQNDIYIIIDWHVETANNAHTSEAVEFFTWAAQEFGQTNNVIFEVWNEPTNGASMSNVASHANQVIAAIRKYSDNLVLVGSPGWSSQPNACATAGIQDSKKNFACTLHFYADSHHQDGDYARNAQSAMDAGVPVFASEWGTVNANGDGQPNKSESKKWVDWMAQNNISWANWSASAKSETSAAFSTNIITDGLKYTDSGDWIKGVLTSGSHSYSDCGLENYVGSKSSDDGFSTGVANGAQTNLIDDFEDGDHYTYTGGQWSAWTDADGDPASSDGVGKTSISNSKFENDFGKTVYEVVTKTSDLKNAGSENTSSYVAAMEDIYINAGDWNNGGYLWDPYAIIGLNFTKDTTEFADFKNCKSISYKYKGAAHNFRVEISSITNFNFHYYSAAPSESWTSVELTLDMFKQHDDWQNPQITSLASSLGKAKRLAWEVNGKAKTRADVNQPTYDYLYIDDVRCDGLSVAAISGKNASEPSSSGSVATKSSASVVPTSSAAVVVSSSSVAPVVKDLLVIDDVEDLDEVLNTTGTWYAYTDKDAGGLSTITNVYDPDLPGYVVVLPGSTDPSNGTQGFVGLSGVVWNQGTYLYDPFVALGLNMNADTSLGVDLSACSGISYRYKGSAHTFKIQDGQVQDFAYHQKGSSDATEWTTVTLEWDNIRQPVGWGDPVDLNHANIKKMSWEVVGYKGVDAQPIIDYLYVDDLKCFVGSTGVKKIVASASGLKLALQGGMLYVNTEKSGAARIQVFDMMGNLVKSVSENMTAGMHQVSLENMANGNYVVRVMMNGAAKTARISIR